MRRGYADTAVGQVHYVEAGEGPPLILLHQTASSSIMWARAMPYFAQRYHVVAMDTPGFGMSDHPAEQPSEGIPYYSQAVIGLLDHLGYEQANIVGFHTGASIAVDVAANSPERVKSLVIAPILAIDDEEERDEWLARDDLKSGWVPDGRGEFLANDILDYVAHFATENDGETYLRELIAKLQAGPNYWWTYVSVVKYDHYAAYCKLQCPVLVLNVEEEVLYSYTVKAHAMGHHSECPPDFSRPHWRIGSPTPGCSILMTSAPKSARSCPQKGPASRTPVSRTRRPSSAGVINHSVGRYMPAALSVAKGACYRALRAAS